MTNKDLIDNDNEHFSDFLKDEDVNVDWGAATLAEKEYQLHCYLNIECSVGVFTNQIGGGDIEIYFNDSHKLIINASDTLDDIDGKIEKFIAPL